MLWRDKVNLISSTNTVNNMGDVIEVPVSKEVYANKQSIRQTEFYQATATGLRPELMFIIHSIDYNQESKLEYPVGSNKLYTIIRTYEKNGELIELICQGLVNGVM